MVFKQTNLYIRQRVTYRFFIMVCAGMKADISVKKADGVDSL